MKQRENLTERIVTIEVTRELIGISKRGDWRHCPIAESILKHAKQGVCVRVGPIMAKLFTSINLQRLPLNGDIRRWINEYDSGKAVDPISFPLSIRAEFLKEL